MLCMTTQMDFLIMLIYSLSIFQNSEIQWKVRMGLGLEAKDIEAIYTWRFYLDLKEIKSEG